MKKEIERLTKQQKIELLSMFKGDLDVQKMSFVMGKTYLYNYPNEKHFRKKFMRESKDFRNVNSGKIVYNRTSYGYSYWMITQQEVIINNYHKNEYK